MLRALRIRIITLAIIAISVVVFAITGTINLLNALWLRNRADETLNIISDFRGVMPSNTHEIEPKAHFSIDEEMPFRTRYFVITTDQNGNIIEKNTANIVSVDDEDISRFNEATRSKPENTYGSVGDFRYLVKKNDSGDRMVTFLDRTQDGEAIRRLLFASLMTAAIGIGVIFLLLILVSKRILQPFVRNHEKQQQFITDAGHELKTPLAIIRTNAEVLEVMNGENEWLDSIKNQTERLDGLVKGLLRLARSGEFTDENEHIKFSLSAAVNEIATPFKALAEKKGLIMHFDITPSIEYKGSAQSISTLVSILVDNAIKYASPGGEVLITLNRMGKGTLKTAKLIVENDTDIDESEDPERFFERFYRSDGSRARESGGYGIGLSVAKTIVEQHKGRITVSRNGNRIAFTAKL